MLTMFLKISHVVDVMFVLMLLLLVLTVVHNGVLNTCGKVMRERNNVDKDNFDGLQINQNWIWKKTDEVEQDGNETIAILTEHDGFKTILKVNKAF